MKKALALLLAVLLCFFASTAFPEDDWDDFDFDEEDMEFEEDEEDDGSLRFDGSYTANDWAGEDAIETFESGDYVYMLNETRDGAITMSYRRNDIDVVVPDKLDQYPVVGIGEHTFESHDKIESVTLPEGIQMIGNMAFTRCSSLKSIVIPEGVTLLDQMCFGACDNLVEVRVPSTVETVGNFAFLACRKLQEISFGNNLQSIGQGAFQLCQELKKITIPKDSVEIGTDAFTDCPSDLEILDSI